MHLGGLDSIGSKTTGQVTFRDFIRFRVERKGGPGWPPRFLENIPFGARKRASK
jgi:hypothetical protein